MPKGTSKMKTLTLCIAGKKRIFGRFHRQSISEIGLILGLDASGTIEAVIYFVAGRVTKSSLDFFLSFLRHSFHEKS